VHRYFQPAREIGRDEPDLDVTMVGSNRDNLLYGTVLAIEVSLVFRFRLPIEIMAFMLYVLDNARDRRTYDMHIPERQSDDVIGDVMIKDDYLNDAIGW
jgi:hypothetical protein